MTAQKVLVLTHQSRDSAQSHATLDELLRAGWTVVSTAPMGGGGQAVGFASLVVLEQAGAAAADILEQIEGAIEAEPEAAAVQDPLLRRLQGDADELGPIEN